MNKEQFNTEAENHKTLEQSVKRLEELKEGKQLADIPLDSAYWDAENVHRALYSGPKE